MNNKLSNVPKQKSLQKGKKPAENTDLKIQLSKLGEVKRTASEFDLHIQNGRIFHILDLLIRKLKLALCLPIFLDNNALLLRCYVTRTEMEFIQGVCLKVSNSFPSSKTSAHPMQKSKTSYEFGAKEKLANSSMSQVMEILWNAPDLKDKINKKFERLVTLRSTTFVKLLYQLKEIVEEKLSVAANEQVAYERNLNRAYHSIHKTQTKIKEAKLVLRKQREDLVQRVKEKEAIANAYQTRINALREKFNMKVTQIISSSEKGMKDDSGASIRRQTELAEELKSATQNYEDMLAQNIRHEKALRAKRTKIEVQLSGWLSKYDADMGERQDQFEELSKNYDLEKLELDALQEKFDEQEEEYVVLMGEKEEEELKVWQEKAYIFISNRSARLIQRYWKAYRQRKLERKKAKKGKGKAKKQRSSEVLLDAEATGSLDLEAQSNLDKPIEEEKEEDEEKPKKNKKAGKGKKK